VKVLAINSSARIGGESKTEFILDFLIKGMKEEGASACGRTVCCRFSGIFCI